MLHRMTVTGERIISPLSDPINCKVRNVNTGAEVDGDDSHPNEPDPMPATARVVELASHYVKPIELVEKAIAYGQVCEMVNDLHEHEGV